MFRQPLRSSESVQVDLMKEDLRALPPSKELRMRLLLLRYLVLTRSAICLPSQMAEVVMCYTFSRRARLRSVEKRQYSQKSKRRLLQRFSSGSSRTLPNFLDRSSPLFAEESSPISLDYLASSSLRPSPISRRKRELKVSSSLVTSSKKPTTQFCWGSAVICSGGLMCEGRLFLLGLFVVSAGCRLESQAIFFFKKLFSRLSCSISMRQHRSSSREDSEEELPKLCQKRVSNDSSRGRRGGSDGEVEFSMVINRYK